jgi:hypothetical protein
MAAKYMVRHSIHSAWAVLLFPSPRRFSPLPIFALALLMLSGAACAPRALRTEPLEKAHAHFSEAQYALALPLVKEYLVHDPHDASAHWLLGACYRNLVPPSLTVAEGEFRLAFEIFETTGHRGALARFEDDTHFEMELHRERALTGMQWILEAMDRGVRARYIHDLAEQALGHVKRARVFDPDNEDLADMESTLRELVREETPKTGGRNALESFSV